MFQTIVEAVLSYAENQPEHLAIGFKNTRISYGELGSQVRRMAVLLHEKYGVSKGDFVMLSAVSMPEYVVCYLAIQYLGAVSVPIDKSQKDGGTDIAAYIQPKLMLLNRIIPDTPNSQLLKSVYQESLEFVTSDLVVPYVAPDDNSLAEILLTTGTTGKPKGGMLSIGSVRAGARNTYIGVAMQPEDIVLIPLPLNHSFGMRVLRAVLFHGLSVVLQNGFTFAKEILNNLNNFGCTGFVCTPAPLEMIYRQMQDKFPEIMGRFRYIEVGAGSLTYDMKRKLLDCLPSTKLVNTWGSTETAGVIFLDVTMYPQKLTSLGKLIPNVDFCAIGLDGKVVNAVNADTAGRMVLRGDMQMLGYYKMPDKTQETLVDGWLVTNDLVYQDEDGFIFMLGRADDIINVGGEKVSPIEVENIAQTFPAVKECACIGIEDPDGILGQIPLLLVVPEESHFDEAELTKFLASKIEKFKLPQQYLVVRELPRNRMGKLDRKAMKKLWDENKNLTVMNETIQNILSRRSVRDFTDQPIPKAYLDMILQCGYYAPSGHNMQTWHFSVITNANQIDRYRDVVARVAKKKGVYFYGLHTPTAMILVSNDPRNRDGIQDSSCAAENMMLAANSYGIGSVWINALMTLCDEPEIRELLNDFGVPKNHIVWATLAMGYPKVPGKLLAKKTNVIHWDSEH